MSKPLSFTLTSKGGLLRHLVTECGVSQGYDPATGGVVPAIFTFNGIWDTGATASVITQNVVNSCGLAATGMTRVQGVGGIDTVETYVVNIHLPNTMGVKHVQVTKGNLGAGADVLIGMDIITLGDFCITNKDNKTVFSFRFPSQSHVDYVNGDGMSRNERRLLKRNKF